MRPVSSHHCTGKRKKPQPSLVAPLLASLCARDAKQAGPPTILLNRTHLTGKTSTGLSSGLSPQQQHQCSTSNDKNHLPMAGSPSARASSNAGPVAQRSRVAASPATPSQLNSRRLARLLSSDPACTSPVAVDVARASGWRGTQRSSSWAFVFVHGRQARGWLQHVLFAAVVQASEPFLSDLI